MTSTACRAGVLWMPLVGVLLVEAAGAQKPVTGSVAGIGMSMQLVRETELATETLTGFAVGGEGRIRLWKSELGFRYVRGSLKTSAGSPGEDMVEAAVMVGSHPVHWLTVKAGPHMRSFASELGTVRWLLWEGRIHVEQRIMGPALRSYVEVWRTLSGGVNMPASLGGAAPAPLASDLSTPSGIGRGLEGGMILEIPGVPVLLRVGYSVDWSNMQDGSVVNTVEALLVTLGVGRR